MSARSALRGFQEGVLVAPHEKDFEQLELEVAPIRRGIERFLHELGGLIVKAVSNVEVGLGHGIGLVEVDDRLARQRLVGRRSGTLRPRRGARGARAARPPAASGRTRSACCSSTTIVCFRQLPAHARGRLASSIFVASPIRALPNGP